MPQGDTEATAPYTDAARARLVMAYEACELSDLARAAVPIGQHELNPDGTTHSPGTVLADAARVLAAAHQLLEAAAVFERMAGADWQLIGDTLDISPQTARACFAIPETTFRENLLSPETTGEMPHLRTHMAREPLETALDLDDWLLHHKNPDTTLDPTPVSGGLLRRASRQPTEQEARRAPGNDKDPDRS
ncbi:hypothetical protein ACWD4G_08410 [Streptomyces sp. NPDC002643]